MGTPIPSSQEGCPPDKLGLEIVSSFTTFEGSSATNQATWNIQEELERANSRFQYQSHINFKATATAKTRLNFAVHPVSTAT